MSDNGGRVRFKLYSEAVRIWLPILLSLCAISMTIYQAQATRRHNRLAMTPRVDLRLTISEDAATLQLSMANVGIGPGIVKDVFLVQGGERFDGGDFAACRILDDRLGRAGDDFDTDCFLMDGDYVMRPGDQVTLYATRPAPGRPKPPVTLPADIDALEAEVRYCSFYDECWSSEDF